MAERLLILLRAALLLARWHVRKHTHRVSAFSVPASVCNGIIYLWCVIPLLLTTNIHICIFFLYYLLLFLLPA